MFRVRYSGHNLTLQSAGVTLNIRSRSPKSYQLFPPPLTTMYLCKFGKNAPAGSGD